MPLYVNDRSCIFHKVYKSSKFLLVKQRVAQGCTLSPTLSLIYININCLLCELEKCPKIGVKFSKNVLFSLPFTNDFVELAETESAFQSLINIVHNYSKWWHFEASVKKCAFGLFPEVGKVSGGWVWGGKSLPILNSYCNLRIEFSCNGSWEQKLGGLY